MKAVIAMAASWALTEAAVQLHRAAGWCVNAVLRVQFWALPEADETDEAGA
ncbi:hypothetical protein IP90_00954 [Luteimonas cucumeris]|uniref:Uncharacterized protein n=1 Tax=Luteimonas cucumeris TaxID=985012 RepID=A0A562LB76_9GAMM|nr:hypothetical protein [Luteimonas cucumeris]TWI04816.1 hypothetical protein IP90_00954 [Luteimonas cucumeris]